MALLCWFLVIGASWGSGPPDRQGLYFGDRAAPVLGTTVEVRVTGIIARAKVTQVFTNPSKDWVEGIYTFPLPDDAAVDTLKMKVGDRTILGVIQSKEEARQAYEAAKLQGSKASLVEQQRPDLFTTSVANVGPGETVEVAIELQQVVKWQRGRFSLRFPMVVRPAEGKASGRRGGRPSHPFAFHADLYPGFPLAKVESPSHAITVASGKGFQYAVDLKRDVEPADSDLLLEWTPAVGREPRAVFYSEEVNGEKYALLMVMPPDAPGAAAARLPRETAFIIDTSGSMQGSSIQQAREALLVGLGKLQPTDWFNVIEFNSTATPVFPESVPASSAALAKAGGFIAGLQADGGTTMAPALQIALRKPAPAGLVPQVIFVTDGDLQDEAEVVQLLKASLGNRRLFPVAIGAAPNAPLLRRLGDLGRGFFTRIANPRKVAEAMGTLFSQLQSPMLRQIEVQWSDPSAEAWPAGIPDLYLGDPLVVTARLQNGAGPVTVSGLQGAKTWQDSFAVPGDFKGAGIDKLWARRKIQGLSDSLADGADPGEVQRVITELGLRHRLVTEFTSLMAVDPQATAPAGLQPVTHVVPVNLPPDEAVSEMIIVTAESPLLDQRRINAAATVSQTELEKVSTREARPALSEAEAKALCAEIQRTGWAKVTLKQALAAAPSLAKTLRQADRAGLLRGCLAVLLRDRGCSEEPPPDVLAEAERYLRR